MVESVSPNKKRCPKPGGCGKRKKLNRFSVSRSRPDGHCVYCSDCTTRMSQTYRDRLKETLGRTSLHPRVYVSVSIKREFENTQRERVIRNLLRIPHTPEEIAAKTGDNEDAIGEVLADFWDKGIVRIDPETRRFRLVQVGVKSPDSGVRTLDQAAA